MEKHLLILPPVNGRMRNWLGLCKNIKCLNVGVNGITLKSRKIGRLNDITAKVAILIAVFKVRPLDTGVSRFYLLRPSERRNASHNFALNIRGKDIKFMINREGGYGILSVYKFEPVVSSFLTSMHGEIFIDIGANAGGYTIPCSANFRKVISIEPGKEARSILLENISLNGISNVEVLSDAICNKEEKVRLYKSRALVNFSLEHESPYFEEVNAVKLDKLLLNNQSVDLLKIDVEGAELEVIMSGLGEIHRVKNIVIEVREIFKEQIIKLQEERNFVCYMLEDRVKISESNLLFVNSSFK
ncbi:MAG: FkbM family methyltransferase [Candidatus Micrarchaeaceae archaeon]